VDVAGLTFVKEGMLPHAQEAADLGLSFVVSAGWMPGISELVPAYADVQARTTMDRVESLIVYFSDSGDWSDNALRDAAWYIRQVQGRFRGPSYFRRGERTRAKMSVAIRKVDLGDPIGHRRFSLVAVSELDEIARQLADCDVLIYSYLSGLRTASECGGLERSWTGEMITNEPAFKLIHAKRHWNLAQYLRNYASSCPLRDSRQPAGARIRAGRTSIHRG
jgi:hypothetical protein